MGGDFESCYPWRYILFQTVLPWQDCSSHCRTFSTLGPHSLNASNNPLIITRSRNTSSALFPNTPFRSDTTSGWEIILVSSCSLALEICFWNMPLYLCQKPQRPGINLFKRRGWKSRHYLKESISCGFSEKTGLLVSVITRNPEIQANFLLILLNNRLCQLYCS